MKNICIAAYTIDELSTDVQKEVIDRNFDIELWDDWYGSTYENWTEQLEAKGYSNIQIQFSGFSSQGDGASFTAKVDATKFIKRNKLGKKYRALLNTAKNSGIGIAVERIRSLYVHSNTIDVTADCYYLTDKAEGQLVELLELIKSEAKALSNAIYEDLQNEYDYLTSDECVVESLRRNEHYFSQTGQPINI